MLKKLDSQGFAIGLASDLTPALAVFGINPGNPVNDQERADVVTHRAPSFERSAFACDSSFFSAPGHRGYGSLYRLVLELIAGLVIILPSPEAVIRSMCK